MQQIDLEFLLILGKNGTIYVFDIEEVQIVATFNYRERIECMAYFNNYTYFGTAKGTIGAMDFESSCDIVAEFNS